MLVLGELPLLQQPDAVLPISQISGRDAGLQPCWACSFPTEHPLPHAFAAVSWEQRGEGRGKVVIYSPKAENDKVSPNEQKHVELNFPKLLPCQRKQQLLVRGKRRT